MKLTPSQAIRKFCIECSGGSKEEVTLCPVRKCHLYVFRMGEEIQKIELDKEVATKPSEKPVEPKKKISILDDIDLIPIEK